MSNANFSPESLEAAGFHESKPNVALHDRFDRVWYKMVKDQIGKAYQVGVRFWDHSKYRVHYPDGWDAEAYFPQADGSACKVNYYAWMDSTTPQDVLDWFDRLWRTMQWPYYRKWEEN